MPCWRGCPPGSVVSFMLPNWHEAAVIYLAATLAGMVVNPILPSLRDRELRFILEDADSRDDLRPATVRRPRLRRDAGPGDRADGRRRPRWWCVRGDAGSHTPYAALFAAAGRGACCRRWIPTPCG